jgi:hypothetical protein
MKKLIVFLLFGASFILCTLLYLKYDSKGFDYGFGCIFCEERMPYGLTPQIDRYYLVYLLDEDGFELTGSGFRHRQSSFKIKNFLGYGYNDSSVLLKCTDSLNNIKYLVSYETGYKTDKGNLAISFKDINDIEYSQIKDSYQWVEINKDRVGKVRLYRTLSFIGAILSLLLIIRSLFKLKSNKATN